MLRQATFAWSFSSRPSELVVDCFAGGGGASLGIERALGRPVDVAINHSRRAIETHERNHPETWHYCEDVFSVDPAEATDGRPIGLAWFSPDCTHFSRAKGAQPRSKQIRGLAWVVIRWAKAVRPRIIMLENVREFAEWGPLNQDGRPCKRRSGVTFRQWLGRLRGLGYEVEHRTLNAADYGAPTHRRRLFLIARRDGKLIRWPEATHGPGRLQPWRTAAECIDWSLPLHSIFLSPDEAKAVGVKRPLAANTLRRIAAGVKRYVVDNPSPFIVRTEHGGDEFRGQSMDHPLATITGHHGFGVVSPSLVPRFGERTGQSPRSHRVDEPIPTVTPREGGGFNLVAASLIKYHSEKGGEHNGCGVDGPLPTQDTSNRFGVVSACMARLGNTSGNGEYTYSADEPVRTIVSKQEDLLVAANMIANHHGEKCWSGADEPVRTICAGGNHHAVVESRIALTVGHRAQEVAAFLSKFYGTGSIGQHLSQCMHTITGKDHFAVVTVTIQGVPMVVDDISLRMLSPRELARAQGFPDSYELLGPRYAQVELIGNSVCPDVAESLVKENVHG